MAEELQLDNTHQFMLINFSKKFTIIFSDMLDPRKGRKHLICRILRI